MTYVDVVLASQRTSLLVHVDEVQAIVNHDRISLADIEAVQIWFRTVRPRRGIEVEEYHCRLHGHGATLDLRMRSHPTDHRRTQTVERIWDGLWAALGTHVLPRLLQEAVEAIEGGGTVTIAGATMAKEGLRVRRRLRRPLHLGWDQVADVHPVPGRVEGIALIADPGRGPRVVARIAGTARNAELFTPLVATLVERHLVGWEPDLTRPLMIDLTEGADGPGSNGSTVGGDPSPP